ncbi:hypothetical protein K502DRAFT_326526 [Neoconidiobolus thromboides FSU 785]|nr:hypothetical protein K502DRAFT_326526 [Neoconidiobolus thromboides FSU 785]
MDFLGSIQQPFSYKDDSSIWCMEAINNNNFILGCSNGIKLLDLDHSITNQTKSHKISKKDTRSLSLLNDNPSLFLSGSRDGIVHLYDLRQKKKTFNRGIIKYDHLVNQIEKYNTYNILCSSVKSGIFMHDYRMIKDNNSELKIIKEFNGYSNEYLYDLKFMIHKDTNTLICGGTDNKLRFWSLIDELSTREPICEFNAPVKQLIPYEYYNSFNQCSKPSFLANYNNNWDLFSL